MNIDKEYLQEEEISAEEEIYDEDLPCHGGCPYCGFLSEVEELSERWEEDIKSDASDS